VRRLRGTCTILLVLVVGMTACSDDEPTSPSTVQIESPYGVVEVQRAPFRFRIQGRADPTVIAAEAGAFYERGGQRIDVGAVVTGRSIEAGHAFVVGTSEGRDADVEIRFVTPRTVAITFQPGSPESVAEIGDRFESPSDEAVYGLTERLRDSAPLAGGEIPADDVTPPEVGSLNRRGEVVEMFVRPTIALYAPFYHSSRGYGLAVAGTMPGTFDVAKTDPSTISFRFETGTRPENRRLTYYVFIGPEHATILDEYTALTGRPYVLPAWAYQHWRWYDDLKMGPAADLDGAAIQYQIADDVKMFDALGIPPGVYHFDRPVLQGEYGFARFEWDDAIVPNAVAMLDRLRRRGYHLTTWSGLWACGALLGDNGYEAQQLGLLAPGAVGTPHCSDTVGTSFILDPTNSATVSWFESRLTEFLLANGLDGIKLDRGEEHIPSTAIDIWADGRNGREVHNDYPTLQAKLHYEALLAAHPDGDFALITRSGYTGTAHYAAVWGGDTAGSESFGLGKGTDLGLRSAIISQQRAAFMGYPIWGSDTGGYYIFKDREVFARWIEFSTFCGLMEIGGKGERTPWNMPTAPADDTEMIDIYRRYTQLRAALLDYIVTAAAEAGRSGLPIARPMVFLDRNDAELRDRWDQYMFGSDFMVAPVWKIGHRSRAVYFPRGHWRSYWDAAEQYDGPVEVTVDAPLDVIPVYVRGDAVVPAPPP
jgi:alpha-D-xyloside xylohydrolase